MNINTKLNIGDTIWHINRFDGCICEVTITTIHITIAKHNPTSLTTATINYGTDDRYVFDHDEGTTWWRTRDEILSHIMLKINSRAKPKTQPTPPAAEKKSTYSNDFDDFFSNPPKKDNVRGHCGSDKSEAKTPPVVEQKNKSTCECRQTEPPAFTDKHELWNVFSHAIGTKLEPKFQQNVEAVVGNIRHELNELYDGIIADKTKKENKSNK